ncbi:MAG: nucleotidyltransferase family protein [Silicimonas sp.]|nr:nucleotidyltransferase family protein [Silicimonas sp.]
MTFPAMIFAAGFGTRMGKLTQSVPKPLVPLAGRPMVDYTIDLLRDAGVERIVANTHYLGDVIEPHLRARNIKVVSEAPDILDTGGGLKAALPALGSDVVLTVNPDAAWTGPNPIKRLQAAWRSDMQALLMLVPLEDAKTPRDAGDFSLEHGEIRRNGSYLYSGAQIIRTNRLNEIMERSFSLNAYWDLLLETGPLHGVVHKGGWCDIGNPAGLRTAERMLQDV